MAGTVPLKMHVLLLDAPQTTHERLYSLRQPPWEASRAVAALARGIALIAVLCAAASPVA